jgi:MoxR-like ATPase
VKELAADLSIPLQDVRALLLDPVDLRGLPFLGPDGRSKWATPDFLPQGGSGILFLDELNAAPAMVQASCYQLVLDRQLTGTRIARPRREVLKLVRKGGFELRYHVDNT